MRTASPACAEAGRASLRPGSKCPRTRHAAFATAAAERLRDLLHRSPRDFGCGPSLWTLELAIETARALELTGIRVSGEIVGLSWRASVCGGAG